MIAESMIGLPYVSVIMTIPGAIAVILASFALFGLMSSTVRSQRNELGLRLVLGATPGITLRMVLGRALLLTGSGIAIGTAAAFSTSRLVSNFIFGVGFLELTAYFLPAAALLAVGWTSAFLPAQQALRTQSIRG